MFVRKGKGENKILKKCVWTIIFKIMFPKISGSQEDNQISISGCPHSLFGRQGHEDTRILLPWKDLSECKFSVTNKSGSQENNQASIFSSLTHFLVAEDTRTLEFCYPDIYLKCSFSTYVLVVCIPVSCVLKPS